MATWASTLLSRAKHLPPTAALERWHAQLVREASSKSRENSSGCSHDGALVLGLGLRLGGEPQVLLALAQHAGGLQEHLAAAVAAQRAALDVGDVAVQSCKALTGIRGDLSLLVSIDLVCDKHHGEELLCCGRGDGECTVVVCAVVKHIRCGMCCLEVVYV